MAGSTANTDILEAINQTVQAINDLVLQCSPLVDVDNSCPPPVINLSCGGETGTDLDGEAGEQGGVPPPGLVAPDPNTTNRKCKSCHMVYQTIYDLINKLQILDPDSYTVLGFTAVLGLVGALVGSSLPPFGTLIGAVAGVVVSLVLSLMTTALDLGDIKTILGTEKSDLICALYNATNTTDARSDFLDILTMAGLTSAETTMLSYMLTNNLLNMIFFTSFAYESAIDAIVVDVDCGTICGACGPGSPCTKAWTFDASVEGWTVEYFLSPGSTALGSWDSGELKSQLTGSGVNAYAWVIWTYDLSGLTVCSQPGDTISVDMRIANNINGVYDIFVIYLDATYDFKTEVIANTVNQNFSLDLTVGKQIVEIQIIHRISLGGGGGSFDMQMYADNATLTLATSPDCP